MSQTNPNVFEWIQSNRLYEDNLFYYTLIIVAWFFIGFFTLGFEFSGFSQQQNLAINFVWYIALCGCMALAPFWYRLFFSKTYNQKRINDIQVKIDAIADEQERQAVLDYMSNDGHLPMRPAQRWALVFLGCCCLFEIFYISAWVKDLTLVWQPDWVIHIIDWVKNNTNTPPLNVDRKLFMVEVKGDKVLEKMFKNEHDFLNSNFGNTALLFQFWKALIFFPVIFALISILGKGIGWTGLNNIKPINTMNIKSLLWVSFLSFFMFLMMIGVFVGLFQVIGETTLKMLMGKVSWLSSFWINIGYIFFIFGLSLTFGWVLFWKDLMFKLYRKIIK